MPFVAPIVAALGPVLTSIILSVTLTLVQAGLTKAFQKKPNKQRLGFDERTQTGFDTLAPWRIPLGEGRVGGTVVYKQTTTNRQNLWLVVAFGPGEWESMDDVWMGDEPAYSSGASDGSVQGTYATKLFVWKHLGDPDDVVDENLAAAFPDEWTDAHRLRGIAYMVMKLVYDVNLYGRGIPNPSVNFKGYKNVVDPRTGQEGWTDNAAVLIRAWLRNSTWGLRAKSYEIDDQSFNDEADYCDEIVAVPQRRYIGKHRHGRVFTANASTDLLTITSGFSGDDAEGGLRRNDPVKVSSGGTLPAPLVAGTTYYARPASNTTVSFTNKLAADPDSDDTIDLTTAGSGTHLISLIAYRLTLDGSWVHVLGDASISEETILFESQQNASFPTMRYYKTADRVIFTVPAGTLPTGVTAGTTYYAIVGTNYPFNMRLATTRANAEAGTNILLTSNGGAGPVMSWLGGHGGTVTANPNDDNLTLLEDKNYQTGDVVLFETDGTLPAPLEVGRGYYAIRTGALTFRVAETRWKAGKGLWLDIADAGSGSHGVFAAAMEHALVPSLPTGSVVRLEGTPFGTIAGGISLDRDYYAINRAHGQAGCIIDLADSLVDARAGIAVRTTDAPLDESVAHTVAYVKEPRYTLNGVISTEETYGDTLKAMLTSCGGAIDPNGGRMRLLVGRYRPPHVPLTDDDVVGSVKVTSRLRSAKAANAITGAFTSARSLDEAINFPTLVDDDALELNDGDRDDDDVLLPFTNSESMSLRLATIELNHRQRGKTAELTVDLAKGWWLRGGDTVVLDATGLEPDDGTPQVYKVVTWRLTMRDEGDGAPPLPAVELVLQEDDPQAYRVATTSGERASEKSALT